MQQKHCGPGPAPPECDAMPPAADQRVVFGDPFRGPGRTASPGHRVTPGFESADDSSTAIGLTFQCWRRVSQRDRWL